MRLKVDPNAITHIPVLVEYLQKTKGDVLELGMGIGSSLILHEMCRDRKLVSYEDLEPYMNYFTNLRTSWHDVLLASDWNTIDIVKPWSIVFVDTSPGPSRRDLARKVKDVADYVIVHDTEPQHDRFYRFRRMFEAFKYRKDYTFSSVHTTVLSNKIEL